MSEKKRPELLVETGKLAGRRFAVPDGGLRLGRSSSNDIRIPDEELSRNHCLFETSGESGVRLVDLASANGTRVNGRTVGAEPVELKPGDSITLGSSTIRVVGEGEPAPSAASAPVAPAPGIEIDLGLGSQPPQAPAVPSAASSVPRKRGPVIRLLWLLAVVVLGLAAYLLSVDPGASGPGSKPDGESVQPLADEKRVVEMSYEKVSASSESIFRYRMDLSPDGTLKVVVDDVPGANRHVVKSVRLGAAALARVQEIFADSEFIALDRDYAGPVEEPPRLESCEVKVVFARRVKAVRVANTPEPDAFRRMRERLEAFSKNELGIWAIQYSADKLIELAEASAQTAQTKWNDRDVEYGNIQAAIAAWREAMVYLETVNPKPAVYETYRSAKEMAAAELDRRYAEQRFRVDRAINLADWTAAASELRILCEMVSNRDDERFREAAAKLVDVEKRQREGGAK